MCAGDERVESGGLFVCPVRLLESNGSFAQAGFDSLELVISCSSRLRPSSDIPGHDVSYSGWLLFLVVTTIVKKLLRELHYEFGQHVRLFVMGVVLWVGRRLATTGWRPVCCPWMVVLLSCHTIRVGITGCRTCGVCLSCECWACVAGVGTTGCRFPPYGRAMLGVRSCSMLFWGLGLLLMLGSPFLALPGHGRLASGASDMPLEHDSVRVVWLCVLEVSNVLIDLVSGRAVRWAEGFLDQLLGCDILDRFADL